MGCIYKRGATYWIKYSREGRAYYESSGSKKHEDAKRILRLREGDIERGVPVTPRIGRMRFEEAADDLLTDYLVNKRRSSDGVKRRIRLGLEPFFRGRRMTQISTADINRYIQVRQTAEAANATINRELAALKRMYNMAITAGKLLHRPHIPMLREDNTRTGFFERHQFESVRAQLPAELRGLVTLAYTFGWRISSEVLPLRWLQIDQQAGTIRLEPGTTKNTSGRTVAYIEIDEVREAIELEWQRHLALQRDGTICPWVFFRKQGAQIKTFRRAWVSACRRAGVAGRVLHDFRRTAVRNFERVGVPRKVAMAMVGHKTESVYRRYDIVTESDLHDAAAKMNAAMVTKMVTIRRSGA